MDQIEKNKVELWELMKQIGSAPLGRSDVSNLGTLMSAYKALCMLSEEEHAEPEPPGVARAHAKMPPSA